MLLVVGQTFDLEQIERRVSARLPLATRRKTGITQGQILEEGNKITSFTAVFMASFPMAITLSTEND